LHCRKYFPHAEEYESSDVGKAGEEATAVADAPETTTTEVQDPSSTDKLERASKKDNSSDKQPEEEPEAKRIKPSHDSAKAGEAEEARETGETRAKDEASDENWQKIERVAVPHKVTVEDVVDESETAAAKV
jgi:hypothetical protein